MFSRFLIKLARRPLVNIKTSRAMGSCSAENQSQSVQRPIRLEESGKVRLGFIPEEWFQLYYNRTGVTGPYVFGAGLLTYLVSKEIYVLEHEYYTGLSLAIMITYAVKTFGPKLAAYCDKEYEKIEKEWKDARTLELSTLAKMVEHEKEEQWRAQGALILIEARKDNVKLQLDAAHRERILIVYTAVKNYLDYFIECNNIEKRLAHKNKVNWVVKEVLKEISTDQDEKAIEKCYADLTAQATRLK